MTAGTTPLIGIQALNMLMERGFTPSDALGPLGASASYQQFTLDCGAAVVVAVMESDEIYEVHVNGQPGGNLYSVKLAGASARMAEAILVAAEADALNI